MANDIFSPRLKRTGTYGYDSNGVFGLTGTKSAKLASINKDKETVDGYEEKLAGLQALTSPTADDVRKIKWYQEHIALVRDRIAREESRLSL